MSDIAERNAATILASELATFEIESGIDLKAADPRRLFLQSATLLIAHQRALLDWSAKQNLVGQASSVHLPGLGALWALTQTTGEATEDYRDRIEAEPDVVRVGGPATNYTTIVSAASNAVLDVAIDVNPTQVDTYITQTGTIAASAELVATVDAAIQAAETHVLGDYLVTFAAPTASYNLEGRYFIGRSHSEDEDDIHTAVAAAVQAWHDWTSAKIGRDISPSRLVAAVLEAGAKRVELTFPSGHTTLVATEVGLVDYDAFVYGGLEDD